MFPHKIYIDGIEIADSSAIATQLRAFFRTPFVFHDLEADNLRSLLYALMHTKPEEQAAICQARPKQARTDSAGAKNFFFIDQTFVPISSPRGQALITDMFTAMLRAYPAATDWLFELRSVEVGFTLNEEDTLQLPLSAMEIQRQFERLQQQVILDETGSVSA